MSECRLREGDQQLPVPNDLPHIHDLVSEDVQARKRLGQKRYGTALQPFNGRDSVRDAYEEVLDLGVYLRTLQAEQDMMREWLMQALPILRVMGDPNILPDAAEWERWQSRAHALWLTLRERLQDPVEVPEV